MSGFGFNSAPSLGAFDTISDERTLLLDLTAFRAWRFSPEHYLCIDPCLVVEKLASYWSVNQALDTDERRYQFSSLWGLLFEDYVLEVLRHAVPSESRLIENPFYQSPHEEAFDALLLEGRHAVVIEVKGLFAKAAEKYAGLFLPFFKGIAGKFGNQPGAAVQQLAKNVRYTFGVPRRRLVPSVPVSEIRCVWPVVVVLEPILGLGIASGPLVQRFLHRICKLVPQANTSVRPVVFFRLRTWR